MSTAAVVFAAATAWLAQDPDADTRAELSALLAAARADGPGALAELHDRFERRLEFGTAGLRGQIGAGSNRMNRVLVSQAAAGLAEYLLAGHRGSLTNSGEPTVVIGYDGRINSRVFAIDTAEIMAGAGIGVTLLPRMLPTPVLAFAVRRLGASAGVMVTASHNPGSDNGYKVYLGGAHGGSQIVAPADTAIEASILSIAAATSVLDLPRSSAYSIAGEEVIDAYVNLTCALTARPTLAPHFVYTALHGVGWEIAGRVFEQAGFGRPDTVEAQIEPDARFPTVPFPNPEETGALDMAIARAIRVGASLVVANDPDADRLAIVAPDENGTWQRLSGNEVGALLGWRAAERHATLTASGVGTFASSVVSSPALAEIARHYGLKHTETLTGFKWISRVPNLVYGFEEALGYLVDPAKIRDKDGISAAVDFLGLVADLTDRGSSLTEHRRDFARLFGAFASRQISLRVTSLAQLDALMTRLRENPPSVIGEVRIRKTTDFATGFAGFAASDILRYQLEDGSRVIVRPSGTEPKLKVYLDASSTVGTAQERERAANAVVSALENAMRSLLGS